MVQDHVSVNDFKKWAANNGYSSKEHGWGMMTILNLAWDAGRKAERAKCADEIDTWSVNPDPKIGPVCKALAERLRALPNRPKGSIP